MVKRDSKKLIITDVDGVLTDGGIYIGRKGEIFKRFSVKDGSAISRWLHGGGDMAWITGRESAMVEKRAAELGVGHVFQDVTDKASRVQSLCDKSDYSLAQTIYVGDSYSDVEALEIAGIGAAPADAMRSAKESATHVLETNGGDGVIYELLTETLRPNNW